ncbi:MAG: hypothetical protein F9B45_07355 [Phycisphaera sp. RhM]|nr:hypothetical protein [Phycisphaera sp. RhM]
MRDRVTSVASAIFVVLAALSSATDSAAKAPPPFDPAGAANLQGGLIVQLGGQNTDAAARLSQSGRYLIHVLDPDAQVTNLHSSDCVSRGTTVWLGPSTFAIRSGFPMPKTWST